MLLPVLWIFICLLCIALVSCAYTAYSLAALNTDAIMEKTAGVNISERAYIKLHKNTSRVNISVGASIFIFYVLMAALLYKVFSATLIYEQKWILLLTVLASTFLATILGFYLPLWLGSKNPLNAWKIGALPLFLIYILLFPVTQLILWFRSKLISGKIHPAVFNQKTIMNTSLDYSSDLNDINLPVADQEIYQNAMEFGSLRVRDCMIPRTDIVAIEIDDDMELVKQHFINSGHSKLLVYRESIDNVIGYIHQIDMYRKPADIQKIVMPITIATESMPASELLKQLIEKRRSIAVVVDEFGGTGGMVTIEDLIEEIIGDIEDEFDVDDETERKISEDEYIFSARLEIEYLNETYNLNLPEGDYDTLGGLISFTHQNIPKPGDVILLLPFEFTILSTEQARILDVRVKIIPITEAEEE